MSKAKVWPDSEGGFWGVAIWCPGCEIVHSMPISNWSPPGVTECSAPTQYARWTFNGDLDNPTMAPSLLVRTGHYCDGTKPEECHLCMRAKEKERKSYCQICHSFIENGHIRFLADCTHKLAGQTVELRDFHERSAS